MNGCTPGKRRRGRTGARGGAGGGGVGGGVVRHSPQTLIPSSPGTTSSGSMAPATGRQDWTGGVGSARGVTGRTWCAAPRKPLFLRRRAPRLPNQRRRQQAGRGASLPANPYSFVAEHHVFQIKGAGGGPDVVRRSPQTLIPSSPGTTSSGSKAPAAGRAAPRYETTCIGPRDGGPVQVVLFIITIPTQRHRCTAGSRCPSGR